MIDRVLIVDDDPFALRLLEKHLRNAGYEVLTADNGRDALRIVHGEGCQIVITDWMMPEMDGLMLCRAIRTSEATGFVYIIIVTALEEATKVVEAFDAGVDDYLCKPFNPSELLARLKAGTRILRLEQDLARQNRAVHKANAELALLNDQLERVATTDELTDLPNRRQALRRLSEEWSNALRRQFPISCMMLDIDFFKKINDTYGHDAGDLVLRHTAKVLKENTRAGEYPCRIGGEEFFILCASSSVDEASKAAERLRRAVEASPASINGKDVTVTVSIGVVMRDARCESTDSLLRFADEALYEAKRRGRNRVCVSRSNGIEEVAPTKTASAS